MQGGQRVEVNSEHSQDCAFCSYSEGYSYTPRERQTWWEALPGDFLEGNNKEMTEASPVQRHLGGLSTDVLMKLSPLGKGMRVLTSLRQNRRGTKERGITSDVTTQPCQFPAVRAAGRPKYYP